MTEDVFFDDGDDDEMPKMWQEFYRSIDLKLDSIRPKRASLKERDWREPVYGWARNHIPDESTIIHRFAEKEVDRREAQATRRGNDILKLYWEGQAPLFWNDIGQWPIKVDREQRVRLDACTPQDFEDAATLLQDTALKTYNHAMMVVQAERELARRARDAGLIIVALLGDLSPRSEQRGA